MSCRSYRQHLVDVADGQPAPARLEAHLAECPGCRAALDDLRAALALADAAGVPEPPVVALGRVWERLEPKLDVADRERGVLRYGVLFSRRRVAVGVLAAAASVVAAVGLWQLAQVPDPARPRRVPSLETLRATAEVEAFLDRSKPLLLVVANRDVARDAAAGILDPSAERAAARRLAADAAALRRRLTSSRFDGERELVTSLERLFLQLANTPDRQYQDGLAVVRAAVEDDAILFRLTAGELLRGRPGRAIPSA